ncbi:sodium/proline symporter PutP [Thorsellia kenyensis]|uniref:Sodium/proline symporter n=1 Tax=Thorsellia kenyensis TaxID=1549888 RepID=A0ABV6C9C1_9GAMM
MQWNDPTFITFLLYIALMLLIGFIAYRSTKNLSDYILGGRRLGSFVTALSAGASDMSGWLLMGLPGAILVSGLSASWIAIGLIIGAYLNWRYVAGRLRLHTEYNGNSLTLPDYFANRFEDKSNVLRIISAIVILIFFTIYCASGVVAAAKLFTSTFSISYEEAIWWGASATIAYTFIGGFLAVSWTDTIQASFMIFALLLTPVMMIMHSDGVTASLDVIRASSVSYLQMIGDFKLVTLLGIISSLAWGLGYFGQPHILVRFMAASSVQAIPNARRISMTWMILCLGGAVAVGFFGISFLETTLGSTQKSYLLDTAGNQERIFIIAAQLLFNPWVAGVLLSAILAAIMSTLSCQLLVCSSSLTEDIYKTYVRPHATQTELVWTGRLMVLLVAIIAILIASDQNSKVLGLVSYAWAGFGAAFGPIIIYSVFWNKLSRNGAITGMIVGAATVLIWENIPLLQSTLYSLVPGFICSAASVYIVSRFFSEASLTMQSRFDKVSREYDKLMN